MCVFNVNTSVENIDSYQMDGEWKAHSSSRLGRMSGYESSQALWLCNDDYKWISYEWFL